MLKSFFIIILNLFLINTAFAQKKSDTLVYYLKNSGAVTAAKDSADFFLLIMPPDTTVDRKLFVVKEFYPGGQLRLAGNSITNTLNDLKFQGSQIMFFPNGHKMSIRSYDDGNPVEDVIEYYPNGKLYNIKTYVKVIQTKPTLFDEFNLLLKTCKDSTGTLLAENGDGTWMKFLDASFKKAYATGQVKDGFEEGEWQGKINDSTKYYWLYEKGKLITSYPENAGKDGRPNVETVPEFTGGILAFSKFIGHNIKYSASAIQSGEEGKVVVTFMVEIDGTLSDIKVIKSVSRDLDKEAIRVMSLSPKWKPALRNGKPFRSLYTFPIAFSLSN